jgi:hypothetical protein
MEVLEAFKHIEKAFPTDKEHDGSHGSVKAGDSTKKKMVSFSKHMPKKHCADAKHCVLCKKHQGAHTTHNTTEGCKYKKDGTPKKGL